MKNILTAFILFSLLLTVSAAEKTFMFGTESNPEKVEVSVKDGVYIVICTIKATGSGRVQAQMNELKAKKICLLGIASYRKGEKVSRCSATVRGMSLEKEPTKSGDSLVYVWQVPVDGFTEKTVRTEK